MGLINTWVLFSSSVHVVDWYNSQIVDVGVVSAASCTMIRSFNEIPRDTIFN